MKFGIINSDGKEIFDVSYDPRVVKQSLNDLELIAEDLAKREVALLGRYPTFNSWYQGFLIRKQAATDEATATAVLTQKRTDALAKLTAEDKTILGLT